MWWQFLVVNLTFGMNKTQNGAQLWRIFCLSEKSTSNTDLQLGRHSFNPDLSWENLPSCLDHTFCWKPIWGHSRKKFLLFACSLLTSRDIASLALEPFFFLFSEFQHILKTSSLVEWTTRFLDFSFTGSHYWINWTTACDSNKCLPCMCVIHPYIFIL